MAYSFLKIIALPLSNIISLNLIIIINSSSTFFNIFLNNFILSIKANYSYINKVICLIFTTNISSLFVKIAVYIKNYSINALMLVLFWHQDCGFRNRPRNWAIKFANQERRKSFMLACGRKSRRTRTCVNWINAFWHNVLAKKARYFHIIM